MCYIGYMLLMLCYVSVMLCVCYVCLLYVCVCDVEFDERLQHTLGPDPWHRRAKSIDWRQSRTKIHYHWC